jgi:hypothetical protein
MRKIPFHWALAWIVGSLFFCTGSLYKGVRAYTAWQAEKLHSPRFWVSTIMQTGPQKEALKSEYLAELLGISADRPTSLYAIDLKEAERRLRASPVIRSATVRPLYPSTVYVDYAVRTPIAWLYDYENVALDAEGHLFPMVPFFTPKNLPEVYLGTHPRHSPLAGREAALAMTLLSLLSGCDLGLRRIDVSQAFAETYGKREIVLQVEDVLLMHREDRDVTVRLPRYLRLSTQHYAQELGNYLALRSQLLEEEKAHLSLADGAEGTVVCPQTTIDLRVPRLAFISNDK